MSNTNNNGVNVNGNNGHTNNAANNRNANANDNGNGVNNLNAVASNNGNGAGNLNANGNNVNTNASNGANNVNANANNNGNASNNANANSVSANARNDDEDNTTYKVVVNHEEQYSIWPNERDNALGWFDVGIAGSRKECLDHIERVWTDMRPLSLRKHMEQRYAARAS